MAIIERKERKEDRQKEEIKKEWKKKEKSYNDINKQQIALFE